MLGALMLAQAYLAGEPEEPAVVLTKPFDANQPSAGGTT